jgi:hypothetical protein
MVRLYASPRHSARVDLTRDIAILPPLLPDSSALDCYDDPATGGPESKDMSLPRAIALASMLVLAGLSAALAQFPPPPNPNASPFPPPPGQSSPFPSPQAPGAAPPSSPFPAPGQQPLAQNPCEAFMPIRATAEKDAAAIKSASDRKASREEVCPLFKRFATSEAKMVKFLKDNQSRCGVPADAVKQAGLNHNKTVQIRNAVCSTGPAPAAPRLGDAFSTPPMPDTRPGRGTFDTLTGNPLQR